MSDMKRGRTSPASVLDEPEPRPEAMMILSKIISRYSWDRLQSFHEVLPGSRIEHLKKGTGLFILHVPAGGAAERGE